MFLQGALVTKTAKYKTEKLSFLVTRHFQLSEKFMSYVRWEASIMRNYLYLPYKIEDVNVNICAIKVSDFIVNLGSEKWSRLTGMKKFEMQANFKSFPLIQVLLKSEYQSLSRIKCLDKLTQKLALDNLQH